MTAHVQVYEVDGLDDVSTHLGLSNVLVPTRFYLSKRSVRLFCTSGFGSILPTADRRNTPMLCRIGQQAYVASISTLFIYFFG